MNRRNALPLMIASLLASGCASGPERRPDLAGNWTFTVNTGRNVTQGAMTLVADGAQYRGTLTTNQGSNVLAVRSLAVRRADIEMTVDSPNGVVVFKGILRVDGRAFDGIVTYHNGQSFPMSGAKT